MSAFNQKRKLETSPLVTHASEERVDEALEKMQATNTEREQITEQETKFSDLFSQKLHNDWIGPT